MMETRKLEDLLLVNFLKWDKVGGYVARADTAGYTFITTFASGKAWLAIAHVRPSGTMQVCSSEVEAYKWCQEEFQRLMNPSA